MHDYYACLTGAIITIREEYGGGLQGDCGVHAYSRKEILYILKMMYAIVKGVIRHIEHKHNTSLKLIIHYTCSAGYFCMIIIILFCAPGN